MGATVSACGVVVAVVETVDVAWRILMFLVVEAKVSCELTSPVTFLEAATREQTQ